MKKITIKEFAEQAMNLAPGASIRFSVTDEDFKTLEYVISFIRFADFCCLLANCSGGGRPLAIDVTIYDESLINICDALDKYINGGSGNYGYVDVMDGCCCDYEQKQAAARKTYKVLSRMETEPMRLSVHLDKRRLQDIAGKYLSTLFGREITAFYDRWEYYHWGFNIADTPLSKEEIEKLFLVAGADDFDRDSNDFGDYPIMELNQGLAEKMLAPELPFIMDSSLADDEGVWFFGPPENQQLNILVTYPESDLVADCFRFTLKDGAQDDLVSCFCDALNELAGDEEADRLSRLDDVIARVIEKTGCKVAGMSMSFEAEIL